MPQYLFQFAYTGEAWSAMTRNPVDRTETIRGLAESLGGKLIALHYTMGEYDGVIVTELPDDMSAMSFSLRASAAGHVRATKTTRLYSAAEAMSAMKKAGEKSYSAPS